MHLVLAVIRILQKSLQWLLVWLYYVCIICAFGALLGTISHVTLGPLFVEDPDYIYLAAFGFLNGLKYAGVWAGGAAIVLSVIRAHKNHTAKQSSKH